MEEQKKEMTFEAALTRLDQIVRQLESNNVPLDDLMKLYDEGNEMIRFCNKKLEDASSKVKLAKEQNGVPVTEDFEG
ncbi:MAG: exodeoxyribonuclease VII small subunit [Clostridia bacterium]|nr:exodeoxyribonuclease VII small subunit [Clostridia bacterium]